MVAQRVQKESDVEDFVLHDLRRTAASTMASLGVSNFVVARVLNHVEPGVTKVYNRYSYDAEKRAALERWEEELMTMVRPVKTKRTTGGRVKAGSQRKVS